MPDDTFEKIEQAFNAAVSEREAGRAPAITILSGGDPAVAAEVRALLAFVDAPGADAAAEPFLDPAELHATRIDNAAVRDSLRDELDVSAAGQRVGEFELIAPLGSGGAGAAFAAQQRLPRRPVALKLFRRPVANAEAERRLQRQADLVGRLRHGGLARVYAAGVAELESEAGPVRVPYLATELIEGASLLDHVTRLPANTHGRRVAAIELVAQAAEAVHHAHQRGVIHGNLKPTNVLITTDADGVARVKLLDFDLLGQAVAAGALGYLSPEQVKGGQLADVRTDVYALGVMLYQLLCFRLPILVEGCPLPEAARRVTDDTPPRPSTFERHLRGDIEAVLLRALEKSADRRYPSCADLARDLRRVLAGLPIEAHWDAAAEALRRRVTVYRRLAWLATLVAVAAVTLVIVAWRQR